jgi:cation diffusion facilitator family transporter
MISEPITATSRAAETKRVTAVGAVLNLLLSAAKLLVGWIGQSQSLIADGIHSLSDLLSDGVVYWAAHHAQQDPDQKHPYGHGRFETFATLALGVLLVLAALGIVWDAVARLFTPERLLQPSWVALVVAAISIVSKEWLYHYTMRVACRLKSEMLKANAWHHRSDSVSSIVVMVGIGGTMAGLPYLDAIAAAVVGIMVAKIGWNLGVGACHELVDTGVEEGRLAKIRETIFAIGGVEDIHTLRTRRMAGQVSVDVHVMVEPRISVSEGHMISQTVIDTLLYGFEEVTDVTVHIDPEDDERGTPCKGLPLRREALPLLQNRWRDLLPVAADSDRVRLHYLDGKIDVELCLPLAYYAGSGESDELKRALKEAIRDLPQFGGVRVSFA